MNHFEDVLARLDAMKEKIQSQKENPNLDFEAINSLLTEVDGFFFFFLALTDALDEHDQEIESGHFFIWSDGACSGNPGPGGWGTLLAGDGVFQEMSGYSPQTTNNIMELTGALEGIRRTPPGSTIVLTSDSQYLIKGMTEWRFDWKKNSWRKKDGKEILNKEVWIELDKMSKNRSIEWKWIKGHAGHPENERCDQLAREAIANRVGVENAL